MATRFESGVLVCTTCNHPANQHLDGEGCVVIEPDAACFCSAMYVPARNSHGAAPDSVPEAPQNAPQEPSLAYRGTQGHSGTKTSRERAVSEVASGAAGARQTAVLSHLDHLGEYGITVKEVRERTGWHHGQASAALTNLHIAGKIVRLTEVRDRCMVYVMPNYVAGRTVSPYVPQRRNRPSVSDRTIERLEDYLSTARALGIGISVDAVQEIIDQGRTSG